MVAHGINALKGAVVNYLRDNYSIFFHSHHLCWVLAGVFCGAFLFFLLIMMLCDTPRRRHPGPSRGAAMREGRREHQVNGAPRLQREVDGTHRRGGTRTITSFDDASKEWIRSFSGASSPTSMQNSRHGSSSTSRRIQPDEQGAGPSYSTQPTWHGIDSQESLANLAAVGPADYTSQAKSTRRPSALWPARGRLRPNWAAKISCWSLR